MNRIVRNQHFDPCISFRKCQHVMKPHRSVPFFFSEIQDQSDHRHYSVLPEEGRKAGFQSQTLPVFLFCSSYLILIVRAVKLHDADRRAVIDLFLVFNAKKHQLYAVLLVHFHHIPDMLVRPRIFRPGLNGIFCHQASGIDHLLSAIHPGVEQIRKDLWI